MRDLLRYSLSTKPQSRETLRRQRISRTLRERRPKYLVRGKEMTVTEIARAAGISYQSVQRRIADGWPHDKLTLPRQPGRNHKGEGAWRFV